MPLEIKAFTKLPVVASAKSPSPGKPLASYAVLFSDFGSTEQLLGSAAYVGATPGGLAVLPAAPASGSSETLTAVLA